jgi:glycosyltransferase involved in cell wall biosynthesis
VKVICFPADDIGCGSYRISWPAQYLAHQGHDVHLALLGRRGQGLFELITDADDRLTEVKIPRDTDVVVFQRISRRIHAEAFLWLRKVGIAVVHDMDDDLGRIHSKSAALSTYEDPGGHSWKWCELACQNATLVTTSTERLKDVYGFGHGHVIDNYVPGSYIETEHQDSTLIGWGGSTAAHPEDLAQAGRSVRKLTDEGHRFMVIGPPSDVQRQLHLKPAPRVFRNGQLVDSLYTGRIELMDWARGLSLLGVGIAPLQDTLFNMAKSRLKLAEMSAVGVPWVASPSAEYQRFHKESCTGILACSPTEWYRGLKQLLDNPSMRAEMGEAGRTYMRTQTIEENAWRWLEAWSRALALERK